MKKMMGIGEALTSSISPFNRFSNSPLMLAPACNRARSRERVMVFTTEGLSVSTGIKGSRNHQSEGNQVLRASSVETR